MRIKAKGVALIAFGTLGAMFITMFDIIVGKARNNIGPKSILTLIFCALLIIQGIISLLKKPKA
ncbi:MAG: hypothetical protein CO035_07595 [Candidatus Omnitrophica bacterium CG_4_9_14_0_2_um_filter_42_8]|nr:MAG: hypothetical protein COW92_00465 [Candidatus Omnitrophica bacterium CG22_combo_CG10-13_8_21_14_all_43_16]PJC47073.1 MAG: hypothetical protein CO035_07595 [Candidatus Omnitrophica bacterium CG_4_9_14_0_2_um_filter_42_8]